MVTARTAPGSPALRPAQPSDGPAGTTTPEAAPGGAERLTAGRRYAVVESTVVPGWWLVVDTATAERAGTTRKRRAWRNREAAEVIAGRLESRHQRAAAREAR